jgi:hypothetical protein
MSLFKKYFSLPPVERKLVREALFLGVRFYFLKTFFPFSWYSQWLGKPVGEWRQDADIQEGDLKITGEIRRAVLRVTNHIFTRNNCLLQSVVMKRMLHIRKVETVLYLGVAKSSTKMVAHAWLKMGREIIAGENKNSMFTIISAFN